MTTQARFRQGEDTMPSNIPRFGLTKATLILLGLRTDCCGAKLYVPIGWARGYCESCERRAW